MSDSKQQKGKSSGPGFGVPSVPSQPKPPSFGPGTQASKPKGNSRG